MMLLIFGALLLASAAITIVLNRLPEIAEWGVERVFPGAIADFSSVQFHSPNYLEVHNFVLKSRKDGETLLTLESGTLVFEFDDIRRGRIGEVRLIYPVLNISPRIVEALSPAQTNSNKENKPLPTWSLRRLSCDYAEIHIFGYGNEQLRVSGKTAFDLREVSPAGGPLVLHELLFWDIQTQLTPDMPFLTLDFMHLGLTFEGLLQKKEIASLALQGGQLIIGKALQELTSGGSSPPDAKAEAWKIGSLAIEGVNVRLDDNRPEISDITFKLHTALKNIPLTQAASELGAEEQTVEISDIEVISPLDPFTKVLTVRSAFLRFSLAGLVRKEFESLAILSPTIYVSEDLFWYMDDAQKKNTEESGKGPGWTIEDVRIDFGKLVVGASGRPQYGLPLGFRSRMKNVSLDNLASLQIQAAFEIPEREYVFEAYQLEFFSKEGQLRFSYPPEKGENNLVGTLQLDNIRWRQYRANDAWMSVTFDRQGINGAFGLQAYKGYLSGGFSFFFQSSSPWVGWISGKKMDTQRFSNVVSPENFRMTGPLDFKLQMDAVGSNVDRIKGDFQLTSEGKMEIRKLDDLLANIPANWAPLKKSSTRIALETLRDYPYTDGRGDFWFVQSQGILQLRLQGPTGSRNFHIVLHADDSSEGQWKNLPHTP